MKQPSLRPNDARYRTPDPASRLPFGSLRSALTRDPECGSCPSTQAKGRSERNDKVGARKSLLPHPSAG